jgi:hypothetical protein
MKVVTFSAHSDSYLDAEESKKDMFAKYLKDAGSAFIAIKLKFKVRAELTRPKTASSTNKSPKYRLSILSKTTSSTWSSPNATMTPMWLRTEDQSSS